MKLKEAVDIARKTGYKWVAVDRDKRMFAYASKPLLEVGFGRWVAKKDSFFNRIDDKYTGSKDWINTLRRVKK